MVRIRKFVKVVMVVGARPQFVKASMLCRALKNYRRLKTIVVHTGQHYDTNMSDIFFKELGIAAPKYNLGIGSFTQGAQTGRMLEGLEQVLLREQPQCVVVFGDTNSTLAGALAAAKLEFKSVGSRGVRIPLIVHVEAGLRSYNRRMPEENNRIITDHLAHLLFCPSRLAVKNLKREGVTKGVHNVGDIMYDSLAYFTKKTAPKNVAAKYGLLAKRYYLATIHRQSNTDQAENLKKIVSILGNLNLPVLFPLHPRTKKALGRLKITCANIKFIEPLSYFEMLSAEKNAQAIITDSGGVQKEAFYLDVPCIVLREESEWKELLTTGRNILTGLDIRRVERALKRLRQLRPNHSAKNFYGNGSASIKMAKIIYRSIKERQ
ncbi:MAG: UDP-N-acetylglucosamine 2-epimerase (non-hydrolyzing) [Candidatus Omnitrophota bacterium]